MAESIVNIEVEDLKRVELVKVNGRIDSSNAAEFDNVLKEVVGRKHRQPVREPRLVALRAAFAELQRCRHQRAHRRPAVVDGAATVTADVGLQGHAARLRLRGAAHRALVRAQRLGEFDRDTPAHARLGFAPMEADPEERAAGTAGQAGMGHGRGRWLAGRALSRRHGAAQVPPTRATMAA